MDDKVLTQCMDFDSNDVTDKGVEGGKEEGKGRGEFTQL